MFKPISSRLAVACAAALTLTGGAAAQITSISLGNYTVTGNYALAASVGAVSGLEASAVAYARDRGSLFFVGDEGTGVVEVSLTGQTLGSMAFSGGSNLGWPTASTNRDSEGLTYLGGGVLVVAEERLQDVFRFNYVAGGSVNLATAAFASIGATIGNVGIEGLSYDPRNGNFVTVKQDNPVELRIFSGLTFSPTPAADATPATLFSGASTLFGLNSLSDVQTLAPIDALIGEPAADNLLLLSLDSKRLIEITRTGTILSSLDLASVTAQAIEGLTVDQNGVIYLVAEDSGTPNSRLFVLTVPEPGSAAFLLTGLGLLGSLARRRKTSAQVHA